MLSHLGKIIWCSEYILSSVTSDIAEFRLLNTGMTIRRGAEKPRWLQIYCVEPTLRHGKMLNKFEFNNFADSNNMVEHLEKYHFKWPKLNELDNLRLNERRLQWHFGGCDDIGHGTLHYKTSGYNRRS